MRRKTAIFLISSFISCSIAFFSSISIAQIKFLDLGTKDPILTTDPAQVIGDTTCEENDVRCGAYFTIVNPSDGERTEGIIDPGFLEKHSEAISETMKIIQNVINYALGALAVIALVYLLYHGFFLWTAGSNDAQAKKGKG